MPSYLHTPAFTPAERTAVYSDGPYHSLDQGGNLAMEQKYGVWGETQVVEQSTVKPNPSLRGGFGKGVSLALPPPNQPAAVKPQRATANQDHSERDGSGCPAATPALKKTPLPLKSFIKAAGMRNVLKSYAHNSPRRDAGGGELRRPCGVICWMSASTRLAAPKRPGLDFPGDTGGEGHYKPQAIPGKNDTRVSRRPWSRSDKRSLISRDDVVQKQLTGSPGGKVLRDNLTAITKMGVDDLGANHWWLGSLCTPFVRSELHRDEESRMWLGVVGEGPLGVTSRDNTADVVRRTCPGPSLKKRRRHLGGSPVLETRASLHSSSVFLIQFLGGADPRSVLESKKMFHTNLRGSELSVENPSREEVCNATGSRKRAWQLRTEQGVVGEQGLSTLRKDRVIGPDGLKPEKGYASGADDDVGKQGVTPAFLTKIIYSWKKS